MRRSYQILGTGAICFVNSIQRRLVALSSKCHVLGRPQRSTCDSLSPRLGPASLTSNCHVRLATCPSTSVGQALPPHELPGHYHLHHFRGPVTDLEPDDVPHALLEGQLVGVSVVAVEEQALVNGIDGQPRCPP